MSQYCHSNPIRLIDPFGLDEKEKEESGLTQEEINRIIKTAESKAQTYITWGPDLASRLLDHFRNLYMSGLAYGCIEREKGAKTYTFTGTVSHIYYDHYKFAKRNWKAIPGDPQATDYIFWVWQEYGKAAAFWVHGRESKRVTMEITPGKKKPVGTSTTGEGGVY